VSSHRDTQAYGAVIGQVIDSDTGSPVADASVTVVSGPAGAPDIAALSDANGRFGLSSLSPGRWVLRAMAPGGAVGEGAVVVEIGHSGQIILKVGSRGGGSEFITDEVLGDIAPGEPTQTTDQPPEREEPTTAKLANHYVVVGSGVEATIDTSSLIGEPSVSVLIDGTPLAAPELRSSEHGMEVAGVLENVPDSHTVYVRLTVPRVNVDAQAVLFGGLLLLTTARRPLAAELIAGALHQYETRPVGGTAEVVYF
jgi:hypothetical protein